MTPDTLMRLVEDKPMERLRWLVLSRFSVAPWSRTARRMTDADCLRCACHMVLDRKTSAGAGFTNNPAFDEKKFNFLKGAAE